MKKFFKNLFWTLLTIVGIYILTLVLSMLMNEGTFVMDPTYLYNSNTLMFFGLGMLCYALIKVLKLTDIKSKDKFAAGKGKDSSGKMVDQYYDKKWMPIKDLETKEQYNYCTLKTVGKKKNDGILIRAEKKGKELHINYAAPIHTLVIGTTGSGKTTQYLEPFVQIMCRTQSKPSFVIADPKGELLDHHYECLKDNGYDIKVLDLSEPYNSMKWNPMENAFVKYQAALHIENMLFVHPAGTKVDEETILKTTNFDEKNMQWFEFNKRAYVDKELLFKDMEVRKRELMDDAFNDINDFCSVIATVEDQTQPGWEKGARSFIQGLAIAMLEDSADSRLGMTKEKYNPYNLFRVCSHQDIGERDPRGSLKKYMQYRSKHSKVPALCNTILNAPEQTAKSYFSIVNEKISPFADMGVSLCTSKTEINFKEIARKPSAFFLRIPDYIHTRDGLATICFTQIYKQLVEEAMSYSKPGQYATLKRNVYFLLDEFANIPKFPDFGPTISVARSRGIFYVLVIQSYSQLESKYGQADATTIYNNTPNNIYMGTEDTKTNEDFSKKLGNKTIEMENKSIGSGGGDSKKSENISKNAVSVPLADPHELPIFNTPANDHSIVLTLLKVPYPLKVTFTPWFKAQDLYDVRPPRIPYKSNEALDENAVYYDIVQRNKILEQANRGSDDDDDDDFDFFK